MIPSGVLLYTFPAVEGTRWGFPGRNLFGLSDLKGAVPAVQLVSKNPDRNPVAVFHNILLPGI
jgi:hypothetical protein